MANDGKATGSAPEEQGSLEIAERSVQIAAGSPGMVTPAAGSPSKKLIQLLYEYFGIFMVTFALFQTVVGTHLEQASKDRARGDTLKELGHGHAVGQSGCHSPEENRPCGWKLPQLTFAVIMILANHGVMMWWFYKIWKHVTAPYGTLGYVIQAAEVKREPYFRKFIIYTMAFLLFAMACMLIIPAMDGGEFQGGMIISCFLVFGSISPFWVTVGSKVPLSKTCYDIPIRKLEKTPFRKADNILSLLEDGIIEMASVAASGKPLEMAGTLLKNKLMFTDKDLQLLQASLTATENEQGALWPLFGELQQRVSKVMSEENLEVIQLGLDVMEDAVAF